MAKLITDTARIAELESQMEEMARWLFNVSTQLNKFTEKQAEVDLVTADMLDDLNAQINGLTKRYEGHYHKTPKCAPPRNRG